MNEVKPEPHPAPPLETLEAGFFEPWKQSAFVLSKPAGEAACELMLTDVTLLGHRRPNANREPFSLQFRGPSGLRLVQGIYPLSHPRTGQMEVFITQVGDGPTGSSFEVIFT